MSSTDTRPTAPAPSGPVRRPGAQAALLALAAVGGLGTLGVLAWAGGWFEGGAPRDALGFAVVITLWCLSPFAGAVAVVVASRQALAGGTWALALGLLALLAVTAWLLHDMVTSESSTAALLLLFLPFSQWLLLALTVAAAALVHRFRTRRWRAAA